MRTPSHIVRRATLHVLTCALALHLSSLCIFAAQKHLRVNQVGYLPSDTKVAIVSTEDSLAGWTFSVVKVSDESVAFGPQGVGSDQGSYCAFSHNYRLDFSALTTPGNYKIKLSDGTSESRPFTIGAHAYRGLHEEILKFFRAQRSGYNPFIPATCHASGAAGNLDAKCLDDNQVRDMEGGWYDAGDYIKFLVTTSNVLVLQLFAYKENKAKFADQYGADGTTGSNNIPDVLDEAKHGLDWILKMHPLAAKLYYQVGDSRDHVGRSSWSLPQNDTVNYDLDGYRPAYHGIGANIAGRSAAALAMASKIWEDDLGDATYAATCLAAAETLYALAEQNLHAQGGTEDYYAETTFYDDLELAATELYKATETQSYLDDAITYSSQAGSSWGWFDWGGINALAHYELYSHADSGTQANLKTYLQQDLNANLNQANTNPFRVSTDYGWGSASVMTGTAVMCDLYKKLFPAETTYDALHDEVRDYILGKNQWDVSWVIGLGSNYTIDPHHQISYLLQKEATGTCIEGPMSLSEWNGMGITLADPDEYAEFQSSTAVYHDDVADWATNEPTIFQASLTLCALADMSPPLIVDVQDTISGTSPAYIGANEGGAFSVADLQDSGMNLYRIWTTMGELEYYDDDWVADGYPSWPDYPSATYYGSPTITEIKANTNLVPWSVWDSAFTASRWTGAVTFTTLLDGCLSAGLEPLLVLRTKGPNEGWIDWIPNAPDGDDYWQEWWEYCFAVAYWCNVRNSYGVTHFQVHNEPDLSSQGWTGTQAQYVQLIEYSHDALTFANNLAGLPVHLHAPVVSNYASSYISYSLDNADTYVDAVDYHVYDKYHDIPTSIQSVTQTVSAHNPDSALEPVWITEWGDLDSNYDTVARASTTAQQLVEFAEGGVEGSAIFMLYDWGTAGGLIASDSSKKETYYAHRLATRALAGEKEILGISANDPSKKVVVTRDVNGIYVLAANTGADVTVDLSSAGGGAGSAEIREYSADHKDEVTESAGLLDGVLTFTCPAQGAASAFLSASQIDTDGDGTMDDADTDDDNDGASDADEQASGTSQWDRFDPDRSGSSLQSYVSGIDGSSQVYGLYVPSPYDPWLDHPVVLNGHGFGGSANSSFSDWQKSWANEHGWLLVKLDGRGNTFYDGVGEDDMFRVLEELGGDYTVDEDRIYFEGPSMGGTGAFRQGFRHPDLFGAVAGVDGWGYYPLWHRHWYAPADDPYHVDGSQAPLLQAGCAYHLAENGRNLNVWIIVDSGDGTVWPDNGRYVHQRLQDLGYSHDYTENSGGHCASYNLADLYNYFDGKERDPSPDHVTLKANQLRHGEAYWVRMDRLKISMEFGRIDALVSGTDIQVTTTNVLAYTLKLADSPLAGEPSVTVYQNGSSVYTGPPDEVSVYATINTMDNSITGWSTTDTLPSAMHKTASIEGPFAHAFESGFIIVYGTSGTQGQTNKNKGEADTFCGDWNSWMKASITSIPDSSVTQEDIDNSNLILFGTEDSNSIISSIAANLPFSVTQSTIEINGESYDSTTHGIFVIYPNPENPSKYAVICHGEIKGATEKKMEALPWYWPDFVVFDSVNMPPMSVQNPSRYLAGAFVEAGFFDQYWKTPSDDNDGDGLPNTLDDDDDGDTLSDADENQYGSNPLNTDSDGDGVSDGSEVEWNVDTDIDGLINAMDVDSDNDGYTDYMEYFYGTSPVDDTKFPSILRINFQPGWATAANGYLKDGGWGYSSGRAYGW